MRSSKNWANEMVFNIRKLTNNFFIEASWLVFVKKPNLIMCAIVILFVGLFVIGVNLDPKNPLEQRWTGIIILLSWLALNFAFYGPMIYFIFPRRNYHMAISSAEYCAKAEPGYREILGLMIDAAKASKSPDEINKWFENRKKFEIKKAELKQIEAEYYRLAELARRCREEQAALSKFLEELNKSLDQYSARINQAEKEIELGMRNSLGWAEGRA